MSVRADFEKYLKESDYFADVINTHREATAVVICTFLNLLVKDGKLPEATVLSTLKDLKNLRGSPSIGAEVRRLAALITEALQSGN